MSRAFVKEDEDVVRYREDIEFRKMKEEWLKIQEKKKAFLENDPKAEKIDPEKRRIWLEHINKDIEETRKLLDQTSGK